MTQKSEALADFLDRVLPELEVETERERESLDELLLTEPTPRDTVTPNNYNKEITK